MSIKEIKEAIESQNIYFGIKQAIKNKKNLKTVFIAKDTRDSTVSELNENGIDFNQLRLKKSEIAKQLNLEFYSEVFSTKK